MSLDIHVRSVLSRLVQIYLAGAKAQLSETFFSIDCWSPFCLPLLIITAHTSATGKKYKKNQEQMQTYQEEIQKNQVEKQTNQE